jgi:hypothetical protein
MGDMKLDTNTKKLEGFNGTLIWIYMTEMIRINPGKTILGPRDVISKRIVSPYVVFSGVILTMIKMT